jgi:hypothetical protein
VQKTKTEVDLGVDTNWAPQLTLLDELRAHLVKLQNVSKTKVAIAAAAVAGDSPKSLQKQLENLEVTINMKKVQHPRPLSCFAAAAAAAAAAAESCWD